MKLLGKSIVLGLALSLVLVFAIAPKILAKDGTGDSPTTTTTTTTTPTTSDKTTTKPTETETETPKSPETTEPSAEIHQEIAREKLDDKKKSVCEAHQDNINTAISNVTERSQNQFDRIGQIYQIVAQYYSDKKLSIANYDQLVATVTSTKAAAESADQSLQTAPKFSCTSDGPKADIQSFLNLRLNKATTFAAYRDAVKALVQAVKAAAGTTTTGGSN